MKSLLSIWRPYHDALENGLSEAMAAVEVEEVQPERTLLENDAVQIAKVIGKRRSEAETLEHLISRYTEQLRQTRVSIAAFEAAQGVLTDANHR